MKRLFSDILGKSVYCREVPGIVARVFDLILDPTNGTLVALSVHPSMARVVGVRDVLSWYPQIVIRDTDSITEPEEILRIRDVLTHGYAPFFGNTVVNEAGEVLGKVHDYLINIDTGILVNIMVAKSFLGLVNYQGRVIPWGDIVRVEPEQIVVKDDARVREVQPELVGAV